MRSTNGIGAWWRAMWLYGPRWRALGVSMAVVTVALGWGLVEVLTQPVGSVGPGWLDPLPAWLRTLARSPHADKLVHAALFGTISLGALIALFHIGLGSRWRVGLFTVLGIGLVFGSATEVAQQSVPSRAFDVWDIAADVAGSALAVGLWLGAGALLVGREARHRRGHEAVAMLPIGPRSRFIPHPDVEVQRDPAKGAAGGLLLVHLHTGVAFRLNATGEHLWPGIVAGESAGELADRLAQRYPQAEHQRVRHDTETLLRALWHNHLVLPRDD